MLSMSSEKVKQIQGPDSVETIDILDIEYNELEPLYDKVIKRLKLNYK